MPDGGYDFSEWGWVGGALAALTAGFVAVWRKLRPRLRSPIVKSPEPAAPVEQRSPVRIAPGTTFPVAQRAARIVLVEDQASFMDMLVRHLRAAGFDVIGQVTNSGDAMGLDISLADVALVDLRMNGRSEYRGLDVIMDFRRRRPDLCIVAISADDDRQLTAGRAGANAFWMKHHQTISDLVALINGLFGQPEKG